jgi:Methyltransferase domain
MRLLLALARRLPEPLQTRLKELRDWLYAAGLPRLLWVPKLRTLRSYRDRLSERPLVVVKYLLVDPELENFTYDLANEDELVGLVSASLGADAHEIRGYVAEAKSDTTFHAGLRRRARRRLDVKRRPLFGRRLGWYAIARALKPEVIVETGIHAGLGSALLLQAVATNIREGHPGQVISVDIDPRAGWLVDNALRLYWRPVYGSTFDVLVPALDGLSVGMIVHDSEHTYECESFEFAAAVRHAAPTIALISDNAHATSALRDVCASLGIEYRFFRERSLDHFYPGAGIGFGLLRREPGHERPSEWIAASGSRA